MTWRATVLTLFPEMFPGPLGVSLVAQAQAKNIWSLDVRDIRAHGIGKHRAVDDTAAGGGPGMIMRADVAAAALDAAVDENDKRPAIYFTPRGAPLKQRRVRELSEGPGVLLLCARFEGLDQRVIEARNLEEISVGDFVLAGGEIAAMALIEACARLLPGVLGNTESPVDESFARELLEYPQYTRPADFEGRRIPEVLSSGHHGEIARWRHEQAENLTKERRPDLWALYERARG